MVCIIRSTPSATPRPWLGLIVVTYGGDGEHPALRPWHGRPMVASAIEAARGEAPEWAMAVEGDAAAFHRFGLPLLMVEPGRGLAGCILAGLEWTAARAAETAWLLSIRGDVPEVSPGVASRLAAAVGGGAADMACVLRHGRPDFGCGLYPVGGRRRLRRALARDPAGALTLWTAAARIAGIEADRQSRGRHPAQ